MCRWKRIGKYRKGSRSLGFKDSRNQGKKEAKRHKGTEVLSEESEVRRKSDRGSRR
jgi:hypothetical protein